MVNHRAGPSDLSCRRRARLPGPLSSLKDARAAGFLAPVAPLTFPPRCSRLMSFLSYSWARQRGGDSRHVDYMSMTSEPSNHGLRHLEPHIRRQGDRQQPRPSEGERSSSARGQRRGLVSGSGSRCRRLRTALGFPVRGCAPHLGAPRSLGRHAGADVVLVDAEARRANDRVDLLDSAVG